MSKCSNLTSLEKQVADNPHGNTVPEASPGDVNTTYSPTSLADDVGGGGRPSGKTRPQSVPPHRGGALAMQPSPRNVGKQQRRVKGSPTARAMQAVNDATASLRGTVLFVVFLAVGGVNWFFTILSTALSQLDVVGGGCYTFWGYKEKCDTVSYTRRTQLFTCKEMQRRLQVGAALSVFSILLMTAVLFFALQTLMNHRAECRKRRYALSSAGGEQQSNQEQQQPLVLPPALKWRIVGVCGGALLCELICWVMTVSVCVSRYCEDKKLPPTTTYGAGFGLLMTGWVIEIIVLVVFALVA